MRAAHGDALTRVEAGLTPDERERLRTHLAEEELAGIRAELFDLALDLCRAMRGRVRARA